MMVRRAALLLVAAAAVTAGLFALQSDLPASAWRLRVAATVALLAPLWWPGTAGSRLRSAGLVLAWSLAGVGVAAIVLAALPRGAWPIGAALPCLGLLGLLLLIIHAAGTWLQPLLARGATVAPDDIADAREATGRTLAFALALLAALPLWAGPAAELMLADHPSAIDAVLALSPLTHLAVLAGNDLLRDPWLYQHANLAALPSSYPEPATLAVAYTGIAAAALLAVARPVRRRRTAGAPVPPSPPDLTQDIAS